MQCQRAASNSLRQCRPAARLLLVLLGTAQANVLAWDITHAGVARATTDYVYRGYTKSDDRPTLQVQAAVSAAPGLYAGGWISNVELGKARWEINPYAGFRTAITGNWQVDATISAYLYDAEMIDQPGHYGEFSGSLHYQDWLSLRAAVAIDAYGFGANTPDLEVKIRYPLSDALQVSASAGHSWLAHPAGYEIDYWSIGLSQVLSQRVSCELRWYDAQPNGEKDIASAHTFFEPKMIDGRLVASVSIGF